MIKFQIPTTKCHHMTSQLTTLIDPTVDYYISNDDIDKLLSDFLLSLLIFSSDNVEVDKSSLIDKLDIFEHEAIIFFMAKECIEKYRDVFSPKLEESISFAFYQMPDIIRENKSSPNDSSTKLLMIKVMGTLDFNPYDPLITKMDKSKAYQVILNTSVSICHYNLFMKAMKHINDNNIDINVYESLGFACNEQRAEMAKCLIRDSRFMVNVLTQKVFIRLYSSINNSEVIDALLSKYNLDDTDTLFNCFELIEDYDKFIKLFDKIKNVEALKRYVLTHNISFSDDSRIDRRIIQKLILIGMIHITH